MGADQIKIMASGGVASPTDPVGTSAILRGRDPRHRRGGARGRDLRAGACLHAPRPSRARVRCGVRTIEHGNLIDEPTARLMAEQGAYRRCRPSSPTRRWPARAPQYGLPPESVAKIADVRDAGLRSLEIYRRRRREDGLRHRSAGRHRSATRATSSASAPRSCRRARGHRQRDRDRRRGARHGGQARPDRARSASPICWWSTATRCATWPACSARASTFRW